MEPDDRLLSTFLRVLAEKIETGDATRKEKQAASEAFLTVQLPMHDRAEMINALFLGFYVKTIHGQTDLEHQGTGT